MGKGRPKKPTALRLLQGQAEEVRRGKKGRKGEEPQPPVGVPTRPAHLKGYAEQEWNALAPQLAQLRVLTLADRGALELLCLAYHDYRTAIDELEEHGGLTYEFVGGESGGVSIRRHPAVEIRNNAWTRYRAALSDFGLTPASRAKITVDPEKPHDPVADWRAKHGA